MPNNHVYLVSWDAERIVKAGITSKYRWRTFVTRGARLVALFEVPSWREMHALEERFDADLDYHGVPAFGSALAAEPYLGPGGGGYCECYLMLQASFEHVLAWMVEDVPDWAKRVVPVWHRVALPVGNATVRNGTDGTNEDSGSVERLILRKSTRATGEDSSRSRGEGKS